MKHTKRVVACVLTIWALGGNGCTSCLIPPPAGVLPTAKDAEPNDDVKQAVALALDASGRAELSGSVSPADDVDVYDLGAVEAGDRIVVSVRAASGSTLDALAALFDADIELINYNDDEDYPAGDYDSLIDHIVRHDSTHCYLAVTSSGFAPSKGTYTVEIQAVRGGTVPDTEGQTVLLDFDGATVSIPGDRTYRIGAFEPSRVDARLAGREDEVKETIQNVLEDRYSPYDVEFTTTDDPLPVGVEYSSLVFGGASSTVFGLAEAIDHYNDDLTDEAIIFTDGWANPFSLTPTVDSLLTSIGNVAAHELGHLLGLEHTADITGLMDSSGSADTILVAQEFKVSPLYGQVFPFGWQDASQLLLDTLGLTDGSP